MRDDGPRALVEGLDGAVARAARALDAHARGAVDAQDALCARVDRCADALEALVDAMPTSASEAHAKRLRSLRQRIDGLGASARDLRDRARALHDDARASRRADSSALAAREGDENGWAWTAANACRDAKDAANALVDATLESGENSK